MLLFLAADWHTPRTCRAQGSGAVPGEYRTQGNAGIECCPEGSEKPVCCTHGLESNWPAGQGCPHSLNLREPLLCGRRLPSFRNGDAADADTFVPLFKNWRTCC